MSLFLSDVETDSWAPGQLAAVANRTARTLITRGPKGAIQYGGGAPSSGTLIAATQVRTLVESHVQSATFLPGFRRLPCTFPPGGTCGRCNWCR